MRLVVAPSPMNTITLCQGNFTLMTWRLSGDRSFFDSSKAERLLGWRHP